MNSTGLHHRNKNEMQKLIKLRRVEKVGSGGVRRREKETKVDKTGNANDYANRKTNRKIKVGKSIKFSYIDWKFDTITI